MNGLESITGREQESVPFHSRTSSVWYHLILLTPEEEFKDFPGRRVAAKLVIRSSAPQPCTDDRSCFKMHSINSGYWIAVSCFSEFYTRFKNIDKVEIAISYAK